MKNSRVYLSEKFVAGATFADGTALPAGYYEFDAEGKMVKTEKISNTPMQNVAMYDKYVFL